MKRAARRVAGAVWKGKKPLVDSVTSKRKQFEAETKALEDTEMTEMGGFSRENRFRCGGAGETQKKAPATRKSERTKKRPETEDDRKKGGWKP